MLLGVEFDVVMIMMMIVERVVDLWLVIFVICWFLVDVFVEVMIDWFVVEVIVFDFFDDREMLGWGIV